VGEREIDKIKKIMKDQEKEERKSNIVKYKRDGLRRGYNY